MESNHEVHSDEDNDDDRPVLSAMALAALAEFYEDQKVQEKAEEVGGLDPQEDWELSQFWYNKETTQRLGREVLAVVGSVGRVACLCCPTLYLHLIEHLPPAQSLLFEFDKRFARYPNFVAYDYREPEELEPSLHHSFDLIVLDPPFLSEECLTKCAQTVRLLGTPNTKVILCTGSVQSELAESLLSLRECVEFKPRHTRNLSNDFACFVNYQTISLHKLVE